MFSWSADPPKRSMIVDTSKGGCDMLSPMQLKSVFKGMSNLSCASLAGLNKVVPFSVCTQEAAHGSRVWECLSESSN